MSAETPVRVSAGNPDDAKDIARRRMEVNGYRVLSYGNVVDSHPGSSAWRTFTVYLVVAAR
jgi:hypothetical protein